MAWGRYVGSWNMEHEIPRIPSGIIHIEQLDLWTSDTITAQIIQSHELHESQQWHQMESKPNISQTQRWTELWIPLWTQTTPPSPQSSSADTERERQMEADQSQPATGFLWCSSLHPADPSTTSNTLYSGQLLINLFASPNTGPLPCTVTPDTARSQQAERRRGEREAGKHSADRLALTQK